MKRNQGQTFAGHVGPGWLGRGHGTSCWPSQAPSRGSQDCALAEVASSFLALERCHRASPPRDLAGGDFSLGLGTTLPFMPFPPSASKWLDRQTDKPSISLLAEKCETQSPPTTMETKTAKKTSSMAQDFSPQPRGNVAPEKWAAVTAKITLLGRDGGRSWGVSEGVGKRVCTVTEVPCVSSGL